MNKKFEELIDIFIYWNSKINLSWIKDPYSIYKKHILDSIEILNKDFIDFFDLNKLYNSKLTLIDVWFWWWFPLLPLAILKSERNFIWIESIRKKVNAVSDICDKLNLNNVKLLNARSEKITIKWDIVVARSVAYITKLIPMIKHLVKINWYIFLYKIPSFWEKIDLLLNYPFLEWIWQYRIDNYRWIYVLKMFK